MSQSRGLTDAAWTSIRTCLPLGFGSGTSPNSRTSSPPYRRMKTAFIAADDSGSSGRGPTRGQYRGDELLGHVVRDHVAKLLARLLRERDRLPVAVQVGGARDAEYEVKLERPPLSVIDLAREIGPDEVDELPAADVA